MENVRVEDEGVEKESERVEKEQSKGGIAEPVAKEEGQDQAGLTKVYPLP